MSTYRCQNCGHEFDAGLLFCGKCGAPNQTAQRIHQIEQMLQGEPAPPPGPPKPASAVYPPVPSPAEAVPPPPAPLPSSCRIWRRGSRTRDRQSRPNR